MRRRIAGFHPLVIAAVAGAALGLLGAVLLDRFGDPPGAAGSTRAIRIFIVASIPTASWISMVFGWTSWWEDRAAEFMTMLTLNGAVWGVALTALVGRLRRSPWLRWVAAGSIVAGTALAALFWMAGIPEGPFHGAQGLIFWIQAPGMILLRLGGYDWVVYEDGTFVGGIYRPGLVTLLLFALANSLLTAGYVNVARFTWRWIRMPMLRRSPVADG